MEARVGIAFCYRFIFSIDGQASQTRPKKESNVQKEACASEDVITANKLVEASSHFGKCVTQTC